MAVPDYEYLDEQAQLHQRRFTAEEIAATIRAEAEAAVARIGDFTRSRSFEIRQEACVKTSTRKITRFLHQHSGFRLGT